MKAELKRARRTVRTALERVPPLRGDKIFCIGRNKTGTTSLKTALSDLGYRVGDQRRAERLLTHYKERNWEPIIEYCYTADAFQDVPFSLPFTYVVMDRAFPESKFVLSVRDPDEWYKSYVRHQKNVVGTHELPTVPELKAHPYVWKGWLYDVKRWAGRPEEKFYDEDFLKEQFIRYNQNVKDYFRFKDNLLTINVAETDAYQKLCSFLGCDPLYDRMPWENKTRL